MAARLRALLFMIVYSMRRQLASRKVLVVLALLLCTCMLLFLITMSPRMSDRVSTTWLGHVMTLELFSPFVFPMILVGFGTGALGDDREEKSLVYLLTRPLPRWGIYIGKFVAVVPIGLGFALGGLWILCRIATLTGAPRIDEVFGVMAPAFFLGGLAYLSFFHFLAAVLRHSTIIAVLYVFFIEAVLGTIPGIIKRMSIRFYTSSMIYDSGAPLGIEPPEDMVFQPIPGDTASAVLVGITVGFLMLGTWFFRRREYHDTV